jgi:NAD(P)-dependent dehydrogenase (short-subunit alcohol dehydrogenase family)
VQPGIPTAISDVPPGEKQRMSSPYIVDPHLRIRILPNYSKCNATADRVALPLYGAYSSSKFALEGLSESMRYEERQFGINVILDNYLPPGSILTNW